MKTYQIATPPTGPGIYLLHHKPTGDRYVGQARNLKRRWQEWRAALVDKLGVKNKRMLDLANTTDPHDWDFIVAKEVLPAQVKELDKLERYLIRRLSEVKPAGLLNLAFTRASRGAAYCAAEKKSAAAPGEWHTPKTELLDEAGRPMTYRAAALILEVTQQAVKKRLRAWREKGIVRARICEKTKSILPIDKG